MILNPNIEDLEKLKEFFEEKGFDINFCSHGYTPPLLFAVIYRVKYNIIKYLIDKGADVGYIDSVDGNNIYLDLPKAGIKLQKLILDEGSKVGFDVNSCNRIGFTPLLGAIQFKDYDYILLLLQYGANPNAMMQDGSTPLMSASASGQEKVVKALIDYNAKINFQDIKGKTALMDAAEEGYYDIVKLLVENGAKVEVRDDKGKSAYDYARENKHEKICNYLKNLAKKEKKGKTKE